jgi:hypothetical protein
MSRRPTDMTPIVDLTHARGTGAVRSQRPVYVDLPPPCNRACPAGENIQAWLALAQAGDHRAAWEALVRANPMPAIHGRVCYHPCEDHCNRRGSSATSRPGWPRGTSNRSTTSGGCSAASGLSSPFLIGQSRGTTKSRSASTSPVLSAHRR